MQVKLVPKLVWRILDTSSKLEDVSTIKPCVHFSFHTSSLSPVLLSKLSLASLMALQIVLLFKLADAIVFTNLEKRGNRGFFHIESILYMRLCHNQVQ